jgi:hypothetical protein
MVLRDEAIVGSFLLGEPLSAPGDGTPYEQNDHGADDGSDEPGALIGVVPPQCLAQI